MQARLRGVVRISTGSHLATIDTPTRVQTARLFSTLEYGEQIACRCALFQSRTSLSSRSKRFLRVQAVQEKSHSVFFRAAADSLHFGHPAIIPVALRSFAARLDYAMERNDFVDTLVGSQIVLEGFGEQILSRLNTEMDRRHVGFTRQRNTILRQERSHYAFGLRTLESQLGTSSVRLSQVRELAHEYLCILDRMLVEMCDVFHTLEASPKDYMADLVTTLPHWLRPEKNDFHHYSCLE